MYNVLILRHHLHHSGRDTLISSGTPTKTVQVTRMDARAFNEVVSTITNMEAAAHTGNVNSKTAFVCFFRKIMLIKIPRLPLQVFESYLNTSI